MASRPTTPAQFSISTGKPVKSSNSRPNSRPATPLRRSSRGSQHGKSSTEEHFPLNALQPAFAELSDAMATLEADMGDMQIMHDSLSRFSESFASFLYGLNMNAFCMDFTEAPIQESFQRAAEHEETLGRSTGTAYAADQWRTDYDADATFM
ncbi:DASH complex subunit dam1 [Maublancomyces gigas]|uniref:DASH complex subunit DAM1 n=1 Tax=Discina gigas TaxID=1032678 RepID=A0ABR3GFR2_9PEZI